MHGIERRAAVAGVEDIQITAKPRSAARAAARSGSYLGFIFARGDGRRAVGAALRAAHAQLRFDIAAPIPTVGAIG